MSDADRTNARGWGRRATSCTGRAKALMGGAVLALSLALAACSTAEPEPEPEPEPETPGLTLELDRTIVNVLRGDQSTLSLSVTRTGSVGDVALELQGTLPDGVSAQFAPEVLDGTTAASELTIVADTEASTQTVELSVVARAQESEDSSTLRLDVSGLLVMGRVVDAYGRPLEGVAVHSQGKQDTTGVDGGFILPDVAVPYDVTLVDQPRQVVHRYEGLDDADPELALNASQYEVPDQHSALVEGLLLGGQPLPADEYVLVCVQGVNVVAIGCMDAGGGETDYGLEFSWAGARGADIRLHALHMTVGTEARTTGYLGYFTSDIQVSPGSTEAVDLAYEPVATDHLTGTRRSEGAGSSGSDISVLVAVRFDPSYSLYVAATPPAPTALRSPDAAGSAAFSLPVPQLAGSDWTYDVLAMGPGSGAWIVDTDREVGEVLVPAQPVLSTPPVGGRYEVSGLSGYAKTFLFLWQPKVYPAPTYAVTTMADQASLPVPPCAGPGLEPSGAYWWSVTSGLGSSALEESARFLDSSSVIMGILHRGWLPPAEDGVTTTSDPFDVTFGP